MATEHSTGYCYYCGVSKPISSFSPSQIAPRNGELKGKCKVCTAGQNHKYRSANLEKLRAYSKARQQNPERKEYDRQRSYMRRYGITREQYNEMREAQAYKCAICGRTEMESKLSRWGVLCLDHDHKTGALRKLLCATCNKGLGCFKDDRGMLIAAASYLASFEKTKGIAAK